MLRKPVLLKRHLADYISSEYEACRRRNMSGEALRALRAFTTNLNDEVEELKLIQLLDVQKN